MSERMEVFIANYRWLARYNRWINQRLYDAGEQLSDEERKRDRAAFFGSLHNTLNHLVESAHWYPMSRRLSGQARACRCSACARHARTHPTPQSEPFPGGA